MENKHQGASGRPWIPWIVGVLIFGAAMAWLAVPQANLFQWDNALYLIGAESIATRGDYTLFTQQGPLRAVPKPPLFSAWLSIWWRLAPEFPGNVPILIASAGVLGLGAATACFAMLTRVGIRPGTAALWTVLLLSSPVWAGFQLNLWSEPLFSLLVWAAAALWLGPVPAEPSVGRWGTTGVLLACGYLARSATLPFLGVAGVVAVWLAWRREWLSATVLGVPLLAALSFGRWLMGDTPAYDGFFSVTLRQLGGAAGYAGYCLKSCGLYLTNPHWVDTALPLLVRAPGVVAPMSTMLATGVKLVVMVGSVGLTIAMVLGAIRAKSVAEQLIALACGLYVVQIVLWPCYEPRYGVLLFPFALVWVWRLRPVLLAKAGGRRLLQAGGVALILLVPANTYLSVRQASGSAGRVMTAEVNEVASWLRQNGGERPAVVCCFEYPVQHLFHALGTPLIEDYFLSASVIPSRLIPTEVKRSSRYVIRSSKTANQWQYRLTEALERDRPGLFRPAFTSSQGSFELLAINPVELDRFLHDRGEL